MNSEVREFGQIQKAIVHCRLCPRLVRWREKVAKDKVRRFRQESYWGKPLPSFGHPSARLAIVGLAPAAHGAKPNWQSLHGGLEWRMALRCTPSLWFCESESLRSS